MTSRRGFMAGLAALTLPRPTWADAGGPAYLAAGKQGDGFVLHGLDGDGAPVFALPLPMRGHAAAAHPARPVAVAFARRPGVFALVLDCVMGAVVHHLTPPDGRQFNGHGAYSADGSLLLTSEVVAQTSEGRIGLWETAHYARVGEWNSGGIGPHDIRRLPNGALVVANGGIATDPTDRTKLNIGTMRPNLTLLSPDGAVTDQVELAAEYRQNSIRHLAVTARRVAFAMQWEGDPAEPVPHLGLWTPGTTPTLHSPRDVDMFAMQGYAGSIAATGDRIALTSPKGGVVMIHDAAGAHLATHRRADLCGVAPGAGGFLVSDGSGALHRANDAGLTPLSRGGPAWDNHVVHLG